MQNRKIINPFLTVQQIIDILSRVEDKSQHVLVQDSDEYSFPFKLIQHINSDESGDTAILIKPIYEGDAYGNGNVKISLNERELK